MQLPYTWTDPVTGATLTVGTDITEITAAGEGHYVDSLVGDDARTLAGAVLDAGGVECSIIPRDELEKLTSERDAARSEAARLRLAWTSARRRASEAATAIREYDQDVTHWCAEANRARGEVDRQDATIRLLTQERDDARARMRSSARSMREQAAQEVQSAWPRLVDRRTPAEQCMQVVNAIRALPVPSAQEPPAPGAEAVVHADLPEGLTPCGSGTQDVPATTRIDQVTCLDCLRALAQTRHGDTLRPEDMVEPGDEVPDLVELEGRIDTLEMRLSAVEDRGAPAQAAPVERVPYRGRDGCLWAPDANGVGYRLVEGFGHSASEEGETPLRSLAYVRELHGPLTPEPDPARYRDRHGDIWETHGNGNLRAIGVHPDRFERLNTVLPHAVVEKDHGILARMPGRNDPCAVCNLAPEDQETGPDGRCRHLPATRLGRP